MRQVPRKVIKIFSLIVMVITTSLFTICKKCIYSMFNGRFKTQQNYDISSLLRSATRHGYAQQIFKKIAVSDFSEDAQLYYLRESSFADAKSVVYI